MGAIQLWLLELGRPLGLDLGGLLTLGLCPLPLRPLGVHRQQVGLVPGADLRRTDLRACLRRILWGRFWSRSRLVPARLRRTVLSMVPLWPWLHGADQRSQHLYPQPERLQHEHS